MSGPIVLPATWMDSPQATLTERAVITFTPRIWSVLYVMLGKTEIIFMDGRRGFDIRLPHSGDYIWQYYDC